MQPHQYVDRRSGAVVDERLFADRVIRFLYSGMREHPGRLFRELVGPRSSALLACLYFDSHLKRSLVGNRSFLKACGVCLEECADAPASLDTPRRVFERRIRTGTAGHCPPSRTPWCRPRTPASWWAISAPANRSSSRANSSISANSSAPAR